MKKKKKKFIIVCPYCGKELCKSGFTSSFSDMEIKCSRCGANLEVEITNGIITYHPDKRLSVFVNPKVHHLSIEKYTTLSKKIIAPSATFQFL